jgi:hypothetical protein
MDDRSVIGPLIRPALRTVLRVAAVLAVVLAPALHAGRPQAGLPRLPGGFLHSSRNEALDRRQRWDRVRRETLLSERRVDPERVHCAHGQARRCPRI